MRLNFRRLAVAALFGAAFASCAFGQDGDQTRVDVNLKDADMAAATKALTAETGLQFVFEPGDQAFSKVTLHLASVTAEDAIRYICEAAGATFTKDENGVYKIGHKPSSSAPVTAANSTPPPPAPPAPMHLRKIHLMHADAKEVWDQISGRGPDDSAAAFIDMNRYKEIMSAGNTKIQAPQIMMLGGPSGAMPTPVNTQSYASPPTLTESGSNIQLPGEGANQVGPVGGGGFGGGGFGGGGFGGGGQGGGGIGGGGQGGFGGGGQGGLGGGGLGGAQGGNLPIRGGLLPQQGLQFVSYDPTDNSFIVEGTDEAIRELQNLISYFDVIPKQVTIKVEFVTTSSNKATSMGFNFNYARGNTFAGTAPGTFTRTSDPVFLNFASGNILMDFRTLLTTGEGRTVAAPILRTMNNTPALVTEQTQNYIFITQVVSIGNGNVITQSVPQALNSSTTLAVRPRINEDGTITMALAPQVQQFGQLVRAPDGTEIPTLDTQAINVVARVRSGETVALAGFTSKSDEGSSLRFPILGDLPIIGQFFRSNTKNLTDSELIIFVTPTIVEDTEAGGLTP